MMYVYLCNYSDKIERFSIDECFLDYTESYKMFGDPIKIAYKIKNDIKNNTKKDKNNKDAPPVAPEGAPDAYGAPPPGWDEACEKQFQEDAPQNPGKTRQDWWDFWMADSEGGDDE